ncbi:MAG TPA: hypothetical protein VGH20_01480 [Myxococcales bacterium]|jgi:hypothetical protein
MSEPAMFVPMDALLEGLRESPALRSAMRAGFRVEPDADALNDQALLEHLHDARRARLTHARLVEIGEAILKAVEEHLQTPTTAADLRDLATAASHALSFCLADVPADTARAPLSRGGTMPAESEQ